MRKVLCLGMIIFMLTACAPAPAATPTPAPTSPPAPTAVTVPKGIATPAPSLEPVLEVQMQWMTPDAAYDNSPWWAGQRCFYGEPMTELFPSPEYGRIVPYVGGFFDGSFWENGLVYGLCTADGQIITAPVYGTVFWLSDGEQEAYLLHTAAELSRQTAVLMATDGSWLIELESTKLHEVNGTFYDEFYDPGYLAAKMGGLWGILGYDGQAIEPFTHETSDGLYHEGERGADGEEWNWLGGDIFQVVRYDRNTGTMVYEVAIGELRLPGDLATIKDNQIYVYIGVEYIYNEAKPDEVGDFRHNVVRVFDMEGNYLYDAPDGTHEELFPSPQYFVLWEEDKQTGLLTTFAPDGRPLVAIRPAITLLD